MSRLSVPKDKIRIVLAEGVHESAARLFAANGYVTIERLAASPDPQTLRRLLAEAHILGIRSRTRLTAELIAAAPRLFCVGCFCIGTNQVDLGAAKRAGIPVFNAPYSNTRSVAELALGEIIMLMRRVPEKSALAHRGVWRKSDEGAHEVRGKTLGIVGYGHIGSQLSVLAEAVGMRVRYYDIVEKLSLGNAAPAASLDELLGLADVVSLHVPATAETRGMIGAQTSSPGCGRARCWSTPPAARSSTSRRWPRRSAAATSAAPRSTCSRWSRRAAASRSRARCRA